MPKLVNIKKSVMAADEEHASFIRNIMREKGILMINMIGSPGSGKTTLLVIEHNMDCVMAMAHQVTVMAQGSVLAEGSCDAIVANPEVQRVYLGTSVSCENLGSICRERP